MNTSGFRDFMKQLMDNALLNDIPVSGFFELTPLCNLDCRMCYVHLQEASVGKRMLDGRKWMDNMKQAISKGMIFAVLSGGEAMTHPDFWDIYSFLNKEGVRVRVKTNGVLLDEKNIRRFSECPPTCIDVSLYGCNPESYKAVTGHDVFAKVVNNIRNAVEAGLSVKLMVTPNRYMYPWIDEILEFAAGFQLPVTVNGVLFEAREGIARSKDDYGLSQSEYVYVAKKRKMMFNNNITDEDMEQIADESVIHEIKGLPCAAARRTFSVNWEGVMLPCITFPKELISEDLKALGFDEAFGRMNRAVKEFGSPDECRECSHRMKCHYCPPKHGAYALTHSCDSAFCDTWKKMLDI